MVTQDLASDFRTSAGEVRLKPRVARASTWHSLRLRLPLVMSGLIAIVLGAFLWVAYRQVDAALALAGGARAQAAADQVASLLAQQAQARLDALQRAAQHDAVREHLRAPDARTEAAVRERLATLATRGQPPIDLWDAAGRRVLSVAPGGAPVEPARIPAADAPPPAGISPYHTAQDLVLWEAVADVHDRSPSGGPGDGPRLGAVASRRVLSSAASSEFIARLVGTGAAVKIGNQSGSVWTDFSKPVPAPAVDLTLNGTTEYRGPDGQTRLGAASLVRGTPWAVWVEFPRNTVVAPARVFLTRMALFGAVFVLAAAIAARALSARITTPLRELTDAAEAIADGHRTSPVRTDRRDEIGRLGAAFNSMAAQVDLTQRDLEDRVQQRTAKLAEAGALLEQRYAELTETRRQLDARVEQLHVLTGELESFSYSVSHDLRAPLRHVMGFAEILGRTAGPALDETGQRYVRTISDAAARMGRLIDDLLVFSRMGRAEMMRGRVDLAALVEEVRRDAAVPDGHRIEWTVHPLPAVTGDASMLRQVVDNLVSNAIKYSSTREPARIEIGARAGAAGETVVFVRDNGVGFDMQYAGKLFGVFQRLHRPEEFEGTGIGLANVRRIVSRHGGRTWAESALDQGSTFFFSLPPEAA